MNFEELKKSFNLKFKIGEFKIYLRTCCKKNISKCLFYAKARITTRAFCGWMFCHHWFI
jgi:hypothetical protein